MIYQKAIIINKPVRIVFEILTSIEHMQHWHSSLNSTEHINGTPREFGSRLKLVYDFGNSKMELTETITKKEYPHEFHATYTTEGLRNIQQNFLQVLDKERTKWVCINEFQPTSFYRKAMLFFMPKAFKDQTQRYMTNFKTYLENHFSAIDETN